MPDHNRNPRPRSRADAVMAFVGMTLLILFVRAWLSSDEEPSQADVYEVCEPCGLTRPEIDELRAIVSDTIDRLTRDEMFALFDQQFDDPDHADLCRPCAETIIDAVRATSRTAEHTP